MTSARRFTMLRPSSRRASISAWPIVVAAFAVAIGLGLLSSQVLPLPAQFRLPPVALVVVTVAVLSLPMLVTNWRRGLLIFVIWLMVEDLVRKFAGNDLRVYFVKDFLYAALLVGVWSSREVRGMWREATGFARYTLYLLVAWALVMSVPTGLQDVRLPLLGLRLDFFYVPLVVVGYLLSTQEDLRRWLVILALVGTVTIFMGIAQAFLGMEFLQPQVATPGLNDLALVRGSPGSPVYRPSGTFVDPGRYSAFALLFLSWALTAFVLNSGFRRIAMIIAVVVGGVGVVLAGARGPLVSAIALVVLVIFLTVKGAAKQGRGALISMVIVALALLVAVRVQPATYAPRVGFYSLSLDPRSEVDEWASLWRSYSSDAVNGLAIGGAIGQGTGAQSLGRQYLFGGTGYSTLGLYLVEGGYASIAVEWGWIGLILWVVWTVAWLARGIRRLKRVQDHPLAQAGWILFGWIFLFLVVNFFVGLQVFQNYLANSFFWLLSGALFGLGGGSNASENPSCA